MKIIDKISGWSITDIDNIKDEPNYVTYAQFWAYPIEVREGIRKDYRVAISPQIFTVLDMDDAYKLAIYLHYPNELKQLKDRFGENWWKHYLRFNH